jgi:hypothetical protein
MSQIAWRRIFEMRMRSFYGIDSPLERFEMGVKYIDSGPRRRELNALDQHLEKLETSKPTAGKGPIPSGLDRRDEA